MLVRRGFGLFGGTFDPIHNGHLAVARGALRAMPLSRIDFVLAPRPWQKAVATSVRDRLAMLQEALANEPNIEVNTLEIMREGNTYTIDTLCEMRRLTGPAAPLVLILGADQWKNLHTWRDWRRFTEYAHIALCNRADTAPVDADPEVEAFFKDKFVDAQRITDSPAGRLCTFSIPAHEASSTKIRQILAQFPFDEAMRRLENWLPLRVASYLTARGLYTHPGRSKGA